MKWRLEKWPVSELKEYPANPRKLTEKGLADLRASIEQFGIAEPLVVNTDGTICGGHGRLKILQDMEVEEVDCYLPERALTTDEFKTLNVRLNKNIAGEWDMKLLSTEFDIDDLRDVGFTDFDLGIDGGSDSDAVRKEEADSKSNTKGPTVKIEFPPRVWLLQSDEIVEALENVAQQYGGIPEWPKTRL